MVVNGWELVGLPGVTPSQKPNFQTIEGIMVQSGKVEQVDGISNKKKKFSDQIYEVGELTLTRPFQNDVNDFSIHIVALACIRYGLKLDTVIATKYHKLSPAFSINFQGFRFLTETLPTFDVDGVDKFMVNYTADADDWFPIPRAFNIAGFRLEDLPTPTTGQGATI